MLSNICTETKNIKIRRDTSVILHKIHQYWGLGQHTIPVNKSTRKKWTQFFFEMLSAIKHLVLLPFPFFHIRLYPVAFQRSIYIGVSEEDPSFQVCQENILRSLIPRCIIQIEKKKEKKKINRCMNLKWYNFMSNLIFKQITLF